MLLRKHLAKVSIVFNTISHPQNQPFLKLTPLLTITAEKLGRVKQRYLTLMIERKFSVPSLLVQTLSTYSLHSPR